MALDRMEKARRRGQTKAVVRINVDSMASGGIGGGPTDWKKEEAKRLGAEVKALEKQLADFDPVAAAETVRKKLEIELKLKQLRVQENKLRLES